MKKNFLLLILSVLLLTAGCAKETAAPAPTVPAAETIQSLMGRDKKPEFEDAGWVK